MEHRALHMLVLAATIAVGGCTAPPPIPEAPTVQVEAAQPTVATAPAAPAPEEPALAEQADASKLLNGTSWRAAGGEGPADRWHLTYRFDGDRYTTDGFPVWQESGRITLLAAEGRRLQLHFSERMFDGKRDGPVDRWIEVADDRGSFVMDGVIFVRQRHAATVAQGPEPAPND